MNPNEIVVAVTPGPLTPETVAAGPLMLPVPIEGIGVVTPDSPTVPGSDTTEPASPAVPGVRTFAPGATAEDPSGNDFCVLPARA